ncbi:MAG: hypothetical protein K6F91_05025 [Ruminococcus sp.]|nr:hypothetical protein [Ruminococcus sp.]
MGKKIKKEPLTKAEKVYRGLGIGLFAYTVGCAGAGAALFPKMTENESKTLAIAMSVVFFGYFVYCAVQMFLAFFYYKKTEEFAGIGHGVMLSITTIINIVNLKFFLVMLFEGLGKTDTAKRIIGSSVSETEYLQTLSGTWTALLFGMVAVMILGILCTVKLVKRIGDN